MNNQHQIKYQSSSLPSSLIALSWLFNMIFIIDMTITTTTTTTFIIIIIIIIITVIIIIIFIIIFIIIIIVVIMIINFISMISLTSWTVIHHGISKRHLWFWQQTFVLHWSCVNHYMYFLCNRDINWLVILDGHGRARHISHKAIERQLVASR